MFLTANEQKHTGTETRPSVHWVLNSQSGICFLAMSHSVYSLQQQTFTKCTGDYRDIRLYGKSIK